MQKPAKRERSEWHANDYDYVWPSKSTHVLLPSHVIYIILFIRSFFVNVIFSLLKKRPSIDTCFIKQPNFWKKKIVDRSI